MKWGYCLIRNWYNLLYEVIVVVYLICLNRLNKELLAKKFDAPFELLLYKDAAAMKFFAMALVLFLLGIILIYLAAKLWKRIESFEEAVSVALTIVGIALLLILIIIFIDNPIFRAILSTIFIVGGGAALVAN